MRCRQYGCAKDDRHKARSCTPAADKEVAGSLSDSTGSREHDPGAVTSGSTDPAELLLVPASRQTHPELQERSSSEGAASELCRFSSLLSSAYPSEPRSRLVSAPAPRGAGMPIKRSAPAPCFIALKATGLPLSREPNGRKGARWPDAIDKR